MERNEMIREERERKKEREREREREEERRRKWGEGWKFRCLACN